MSEDASVEIELLAPGAGVGVVSGEAFEGFLKEVVPASSEAATRTNSLDILRRAFPDLNLPESSSTGLVVGRVQSGKTLSFESVAALAADSGFALVILVSGTSVSLLDQSSKRIRKDLTDAVGKRRWHFLASPLASQDLQVLESVVESFRDPDATARDRKPAVVVIMKNRSKIADITIRLRDINFTGIPVLVIDDEADQASLNTKVRAPIPDESVTYSAINDLRAQLPHHAYLQYTATPQANLLIQIADRLSPDFVKVIQPGQGYVGGTEFFRRRPELVKTIIPTPSNPGNEPPEQFMEALRVFLLGRAQLELDGDEEPKSMLIHPSREVLPHEQYKIWAEAVRDRWKGVIADPLASAVERQELVDEFQPAWEELRRTVSDLRPLPKLLQAMKPILRKTYVVEMNTGGGRTRAPQVDWDSGDAFILVGGQAMDRGFTVEGLTVTYMPRERGVGQADTLQQRARFFGYKAGFVDFCRVYLDADVRDDFTAYVDHEEFMQKALLKIEAEGTHLNDWKRSFFLDRSLRPTRKNVLSDPGRKISFSDKWIYDRRPTFDDRAVGRNQIQVAEFRKRLTFSPQSDPRHSESWVPLSDARDLLIAIAFGDDDASHDTWRLLDVLDLALEDEPNEPCLAVDMRPGQHGMRTLGADGTIQPFAGRSGSYPGDLKVFDPDHVTIQIHTFDVNDERGNLVAGQVPVVAIRVPGRLSRDFHVQD